MTALLLTVGAVVLVLATSATAGRRRPWDAALVALAPALIFHAFTNWDLAAAALAGLGIYAWSRRRPGWAGVFLGLAVATKLYPLLFLVPLLFLCLRARRLRQWATTAVTTVGTAVLAYLPILLFTPAYGDNALGQRVVAAPSIWTTLRHGGGWSGVRHALAGVPVVGTSVPGYTSTRNGLMQFFSLNHTRIADFDSVWYGVQRGTSPPKTNHDWSWLQHLKHFVHSYVVHTDHINLLVGIGTVLVLGAVGALALWAPRRPRLPQLLFLAVAGFLLVNKVYSPQYVIWLIPLAALARPKWGAFLFWQLTEVALLVARFMWFIAYSHPGPPGQGPTAGADFGWFEGAVVLRDAALLLLMALVVREILRPAHDVVRRYGDDDPAGGVLNEAPDRSVHELVPQYAPAPASSVRPRASAGGSPAGWP